MVIPGTSFGQKSNAVMIKCKKCGQMAVADSFKLDYEYKTVVCPACYSRKAHAKSVTNTPVGDNTPGFTPASKVYADRDTTGRVNVMGVNVPTRNTATQQEAPRQRISNSPYFESAPKQTPSPSVSRPASSAPAQNPAQNPSIGGASLFNFAMKGSQSAKTTAPAAPSFLNNSTPNSKSVVTSSASAPQSKGFFGLGGSKPQAAPAKPVSKSDGWDKDDEFLELDMIKKKEDAQKFQPASQNLSSTVVGPDMLLVKCYYCNYNFKYNTIKESPKACPYCGKAVDTNSIN